jgi:GT2 family glycosyltransferase
MARTCEYSIIVPFHSNLKALELCLTTLLQTVPNEVEKLVVLNNERDEDATIHLEAWKGIRFVHYKRSLGYPCAINKGATIAAGRKLIFCDADTFYRTPWFGHLTRFHARTPNIGLVSSRLLDPNTFRVLDFGVGFTKYNAPHPQRDMLASDPTVSSRRKVQAACSANVIIEAKLFERLGMFDEGLNNGYCDLDLCLRLNEAGCDCWVISQSTVFHRGNSSNLHNDTYRGDIKAVFWAKNIARIQPDMHRYFKDNIAFKGFGADSAEYLLVDLSSVADREWHHEMLRENFKLISIYNYPMPARDLPAISLIDHLGLNILETRVPILYFVDRFIALRGNHLWHEMRKNKSDLVMDRNANIMRMEEVVNGRC